MHSKMILTNAFSLQMLDLSKPNHIETREISLEDVKRLWNDGYLTSSIGHQDFANILSGMFGGTPVPMNRSNTKLTEGDSIIVAQYVGGRLPEGATTIPADGKITFVTVSHV